MKANTPAAAKWENDYYDMATQRDEVMLRAVNAEAEADALRARAEAAEALAYERLENALFAEQRANDTEAERDGLAARVAELEAMLLEAIPLLGAIARMDAPPPSQEAPAP